MKKFKWPLIVIGGLLLIIITLSIYAYNKLGPEEIREIALTQLSKEFPGAKANIGNLSLSFGLSAIVSLEELELTQEETKLFSVKKIDAHIPFWSMIFGVGTVVIKIDSPHVNFIEYQNTSNWKLAKGKTEVLKTTPEKKTAESSAPVFFLKGVKVDLHLVNFLASYKLYKKEKDSLKLASLKLKNIGFVGPSTINIISEITFGQNFLGLEKSGLNMNKSMFLMKGKIAFADGGIIPYLNIDWSKGPRLKNKKIDMTTSLVGKLWENKLNATLKVQLLKGMITTEISGALNLKKMNPKISGKVRVKDISIGTEKLNGSGDLKATSKKMDLPNFKFTLGKAKGSLALSGVKKSKSLNTFINFSLKSLNLKHFESFFPKDINVVTGHLDSNVKGSVKMIKGKTYPNINFDVDIKNGKIKDFKLEKHIRKILGKTHFLKNLKKRDAAYWATGDFDKLYLKGRKKNITLHLDNFHMIGIKKNIEITAKGTLIEGGKSEVVGDFMDHKKVISVALKDYTGNPTLPFKLNGIGYDLKPNYDYSVNTLLKRTMRNPGKKTIEGLKKLFKF